jgi:hypothetical protein
VAEVEAASLAVEALHRLDDASPTCRNLDLEDFDFLEFFWEGF